MSAIFSPVHSDVSVNNMIGATWPQVKSNFLLCSPYLQYFQRVYITFILHAKHIDICHVVNCSVGYPYTASLHMSSSRKRLCFSVVRIPGCVLFRGCFRHTFSVSHIKENGSVCRISHSFVRMQSWTTNQEWLYLWKILDCFPRFPELNCKHTVVSWMRYFIMWTLLCLLCGLEKAVFYELMRILSSLNLCFCCGIEECDINPVVVTTYWAHHLPYILK